MDKMEEMREYKNVYTNITGKNQELAKEIKGFKGSSVIVSNNQSVPIDEFKKMSNINDLSLYLSANNKENIIAKTAENEKNTLNDLSILTELNNKDAINRILQKNCTDPNTGIFEIDDYFKKYYATTKSEVVNSITKGYELSSDLNDYSVDGKYTGKKESGNTTDILKISQGVKNMVVILKAIGTNTDRVRIDDDYINKIKNNFIKDVTDEVNLAKNIKKTNVKQEPAKAKALEKTLTKEREPEEKVGNKGIADIFVLTVIILVYAVIIINLIMKLN